MRFSSQKHGFTLIELLVVVAIIGMLSSIIMVGLGRSRQQARDSRRLSDINQIKTGLDIYFATSFGYPDTALWNTHQTAKTLLSCNGAGSLVVPNDPFGGYSYIYTAGGNSFSACGGTVWGTYKVQFQTEGDTNFGPGGTYYLSPAGVSSIAPF